MSDPYAPPTTQTAAVPTGDVNLIARVGFFMSLMGVISLFAIGALESVFGSPISVIAACVAFVSLPGLIISIAGLFGRPRRLACCGVAMGIFGSLYLANLFLVIMQLL